MKHKNIVLLFAIFSIAFYCQAKAQTVAFDNDSNLIYNPSFEQHSSCPARIEPYGIMDEVVAWWQPTGGSSDYYNPCGGKQCKIPKNKLGIQYPRSGESMVGIYCSLTDYREYIQTQLKEPLAQGEKYKLSFWVSLSEYSKGAVATIGGLFTKERINDTTRQMLTDRQQKQISSKIKQNISTYYKPQVVNSFNRPLYDTEQWMKIEDTFIAQGGEQFLTIGNFYPEEQSNLINPQNTTNILPGAYYYIDDVELYCLTCSQKQETNGVVISKTKDTVSYTVGKVIVLENIFFDFDKSVLLPQSYVELLNLTKLLNEHPNMKIELSGHTDNKGKESYNQKLSTLRAQAVYDYLTSQGIDKKRLKYKGYGATQPIADNKTDEGRAKNRRVEFKIIDM
ncbi:MAG: OmpA family protein [Bacteroidales bacterium]|nr:OmpA family protein [Bacteroidales bacterium]